MSSVDIAITDPLFGSEESHMIMKAIDIRVNTDIDIAFKPTSINGLLFYSSQHTTEFSGDFIAVSLADGFVMLSMSMGHDMPLVIVSANRSILGKP